MRLSRLIHVVNCEFPNYVHSLPSPDEIDIVKLGKGGAITTDTCNAAMKTRRILVNRIGGTVHEMDCMHHLCNVHLKGVEKALTTYYNTYLKEQLFTDGTSQRQVSFQNMIIDLLSNQNDTLHPLYVSSCIFIEDKTSENKLRV